MANFPETLIPLLLLLLLAVAAAATAQLQPTSFNHSAAADQEPTTLIFQGDAHQVPGFFRLTRANASGYPGTHSAGRILFSAVVTFPEKNRNFSAVMEFLITPVDDTPAEGLAFFIAPHGTTIPDGSGGGNLGIFSPKVPNKNIFAVEFDTFFNEGTDEVTLPHIGIDVESPISRNVTVVGDALVGQKVTAAITYAQETDLISVSIDAGGKNFEVSYVCDLSKVIPKEAQFGISATTGGNVATHGVAWWYVFHASGVAGGRRQVA